MDDDDNSRKIVSTEEQTTTKKIPEGKVETTRRKSVIENPDGSTSYVSQVIEKKTGTGIIGDPQKIEEYSQSVQMGDTKYVDAIRSKKELAIMYEEKVVTYIKINTFERILQLMNENLGSYFDSIAYGIYSSEEIIELRNSVMHNRFLLLYRGLKECYVGESSFKSASLKDNIINLIYFLPDSVRDKCKKEINDCSKERNNENKTSWCIPPMIKVTI